MVAKIIDSNYLNRLDRIIQWEDKLVINRETVSQHSYKVALLARILLRDVFGKPMNEEEWQFYDAVVTYALFHDWDEVFLSRDISHEVKYNTHNGSKLRDELGSYVDFAISSEFGDVDGDFLLNIMNPGKAVKAFVKICDWLAMCNYCKREITMGNSNMMECYTYCVKSLSKAVEYAETLLAEKFNKVIKIKI